MVNVLIYTSLRCPYCDRAKQLLHSKGVAYTEIRVDEDPLEFKKMLARSEGRRSVPQIFINDKGIGGFEELWALEQDGQLDNMLQE